MTPLKSRAEAAIRLAELGQSPLPATVLRLEGMSSPKVRHFLNHVTNYDDTRYLEVGCWKGSTLISALYGHKGIKHWAIDNFCEYHGSEEILRSNCDVELGLTPNFFNADCFALDPVKEGITDVNVYFYDGWHSEEAQYKALTHFYPSLADNFILIVDDWGGTEGIPVRAGTCRAIKDLGLHYIFFAELSDGWWNGLLVAVLGKREKAPVTGS